MNAILTALLLVPHAADLLNLELVPRQLHGLRRMIELLQRHHQPPKPRQGPKSLGLSYLALVPDHKRDSDGKPLPVEKDEDGRAWIEPGETMTFVGRPQVKFSIHSLLVSWRSLSDAKLALADLTLGNVSALAACGELPLVLFADGCKARIPLPQPEIHYPGHTIVARISNPGKVRCPVTLGASVEKWEDGEEEEGTPFPGTFDEENEGPSVDVNLPPDSLWTAAQGAFSALLFERAKRDGTLAKAAQKAASNIGNAGKGEEAPASKQDTGKPVIIGFDSGVTIAPQSVSTIMTRSKIRFLPSKLVISSQIGKNFAVLDVKINGCSQLVGSGEIPAEQLREDAPNPRLAFSPAEAWQDIEIKVQNRSLECSRFEAVIIGKEIE